MNDMKRVFIITILFPILLGGFTICLNGQINGNKFLRNYSYQEFDHQPQNWGMAQAGNGMIYIANNGGVLEYDGVSWRLLYLPDINFRSLAIDKNGTFYVGGKNNLWLLTPDNTGSLNFVSLMDKILHGHKNFGDVWNTHATEEGIYFRTSKFIFYWNYSEMKTCTLPYSPQLSSFTEADYSFKASFICNGELIVQEKSAGLLKAVKGSLLPIPNGVSFAGDRIYMLVPFDPKKNPSTILIGTRYKGFFLYDGKTIKSFTVSAEVDAYLKTNKLTHGIKLSTGDFALATTGGVCIIDSRGQQKEIFDKSYGLEDDYVNYLFQDMCGNLWLCLDKGMSKIEYVSPISIYDERSFLDGLVKSVVKNRHTLYVGTSKGLYYSENSSDFKPIPGISSCRSLDADGNSTLAAAANGVFQVDSSHFQAVLDTPSLVVKFSKYYPDHAWCGTHKDLIVFIKSNNKWQEKHRFDSIEQEIFSIAEDTNGELWLGTITGYAYKIKSPDNFNNGTITSYDSSHNLPAKGIFVAYVADHVVFATTKGLFRFNEEKNRFIPDSTLGPRYTGGENGEHIFRIVEDRDKNIWFHSKSRNFQAVPQPGDSYKIYSQPFHRIPEVQVNNIYCAPEGKNVWFASIEGLFCYDSAFGQSSLKDFQTLLRRVVVNEDHEHERIIFNGYQNQNRKDSKRLVPTFVYKDRNLNFEYAAPFFAAENETYYQYFLKGFDDHWSGWSKNAKKHYTNLSPGRYSFSVRAKNIYGRMGKEAVYQFEILPPWYWTWWAYLLYGAALILTIYLLFHWRFQKLERDKQKLEYTVTERTKEIQQQKHQLENQTILLKDQSERLMEMDKIKSRFFANISHEFRTPLTLILSPLEQMLCDSRDSVQQQQFTIMLRNSQRLLTLINQLLDLARFDSGQMKLQTVCENIVLFLKGIIGSFDLLARQNKLEIVFHHEQEDVLLYFDTQKIEEVMYNLLINAIKFTPAGGKVIVSVNKKQHENNNEEGIYHYVEISVKDTGIGISQEHILHIFNRFYQAENLNQKHHMGTGIGLALTKEIIQLHHGTIDAHSREGEGTEFVIRLPQGHHHLNQDDIVICSEMTPASDKAKEINTLYLKHNEERENESIGNILGNTEPVNEQDDPHLELEKNVILIVEDNDDVRKYIKDPLLKVGYEVVEAENGQEGIEKAKKIIPDLIVSDIVMPEMDGYQLCRILKKEIKTSHIPIIMLTAKASEADIMEGLETGADDYVTKPFNSAILLTRIKNLIDLRRHLQQKIQKKMMLQPSEITVSSMDQQFIKELHAVIEKHLSDLEFNVEKLSEKMYMDRTTLYRKIMALTGEPPKQFIRSYRLHRAAQLLRDNFGNVSQVSMAIGISNMAYFAKLFKEQFLQSPSSYLAAESSKNSKPRLTNDR